MKHTIYVYTIFLFIISCGQNNIKQREIELRKKELALKERELKQAESKINTYNPVIDDKVPEVIFKTHTPCSFSISLPVNFNLEPMYEEGSHDYCDFSVKLSDGYEIIQVHSMLSSRFSFSDMKNGESEIKYLYNKAVKNSELIITYKVQKENWFVISGTQKKNGNIVYWKRVCGISFISDLHIEYPKIKETEIAPHIATISKLFTSK